MTLRATPMALPTAGAEGNRFDRLRQDIVARSLLSVFVGLTLGLGYALASLAFYGPDPSRNGIGAANAVAATGICVTLALLEPKKE